MRAHVIAEFTPRRSGAEWDPNGLRCVERSEPEPGPRQVKLRMRAASLNYRDLLLLQGSYNPRMPLPVIAGSDGVGVIEALGSEVRGLTVGQRVACLFAPQWHDGSPTAEQLRATLGGPLDGVLAETMVIEASSVVPVPEHLTDEEAATLPCAALTAWSALVTLGQIAAGQSVLVLGSGGVSMFALDFARLHGAEVIATSSSDEKLAFMRQRGATATINYKAEPQWGKRVRELTGGRGVDHIVEVGGAGTLEQSLRAIKPGGTISLIGVLASGPQPNLVPAFMNQVRLQGILVGHKASFEAMNRAIALAKLRPVVDRVFAFEDANLAYRHLESAQHIGKVCIAFSS